MLTFLLGLGSGIGIIVGAVMVFGGGLGDDRDVFFGGMAVIVASIGIPIWVLI